eukprot:363974-Chlamydomonas_euryale.AAC.13
MPGSLSYPAAAATFLGGAACPLLLVIRARPRATPKEICRACRLPAEAAVSPLASSVLPHRLFAFRRAKHAHTAWGVVPAPPPQCAWPSSRRVICHNLEKRDDRTEDVLIHPRYPA